MTERAISIPPPIATPTQNALNIAASPSLPEHTLVSAESVEEEPYTIKCICDYSDDDGATIYCERCDTWQHIDCFYHGNAEEASQPDFSHFCADCKPRPLDGRKATERQRKAREERSLTENSDRKPSKRPPSKSHKKKVKPADVHVNGFHDHDNGHHSKSRSPHEHATHSKKKGHRSQNSISSQAAKHSPSLDSRHHSHGHTHPLSPATTPPDLPNDFLMHSYSKQLIDTYNNDPGAQQLPANSFASLQVSNTMSGWLADPAKLREDTHVEDAREVFQMVKPEFDFSSNPWPKLKIDSTEVPVDDGLLHLRYLTIVEPLRQKDALVGELKGVVGLQKHYYLEETDRFASLCHPPPFVFFHPHLPLYIDTRHEGSQCRYIRRSCRANTTLDTLIHQGQYHFCIINERPLASHEQITLPWDFRFPQHISARYLHLLGLSEEEGRFEADPTDIEYAHLSELIYNVLSEYGGCACGLDSECAFARFHRNYRGKLHVQVNGTKSKKGRKPKQHISPISTSRDASEGRQELYDAEDDSRSTSGSVRSKPQSRDLTPFANTSVDGNATGEVVSEREKRKLMEIEKRFEESNQHQPPRKKKRVSDGPVNGSTQQKTKSKSSKMSPSVPPSQVNGLILSNKDANLGRHQSNSPTIELSPNPALRSTSRQASRQASLAASSRQPSIAPRKKNYSDAECQTDFVEDEWYTPKPWANPKKRRRTLLELHRNEHKIWQERNIRRRQAEAAAAKAAVEAGVKVNIPNGVDGPLVPGDSQPFKLPLSDNLHAAVSGIDASTNTLHPTSSDVTTSADVVMTDLPASSTDVKTSPIAASQIQISDRPNPFHPGVDLKVQMPPIPTFPNQPQVVNTVSSAGSVTPSSTTGSVAQSPFGSVHYPSAFSPSVLTSIGQHPSPVKKKLSLSDYKARLKKAPEPGKGAGDNDPASLNGGNQSLSAVIEEAKESGNILEGTAIVDSPTVEKGTDPMAAAAEGLVNGVSSTQAESTL